MKQDKRISLYWLLSFFLLAALPALACSTITGSNGDEASNVVVEATQVAEAEPVEAPTQEPEAQPTDAPETPPTEEPAATPTEEASGGGESVEVESLDEIFRAQRSGLDVDALRIRMISVDSSTGKTTETTLAFVKPDRFSMSSPEFELIVIEDTTYMKDETGAWTEAPFAMGDMFGETLDTFTDEDTVNQLIEDLQVSISDLQFLGEEEINGHQTKVYQYNSSNAFDNSLVLSTVWIGADDGLMYRQAMDVDSGDAQGSLTIEYEYGEDVVIEAPIP